MCNSSCNLSWRSSTALHQTIYPWNLASFTRIFWRRNLNNFLEKIAELSKLSLWREFYISVFRSWCHVGCWCCWPCSSRAVLLCVLLLERDSRMARPSWRVFFWFFPSFPRPSLGAVIGTSSGAWERRRGRNCPARERLQNCAQLCRVWGKGEGNEGLIFSARNAVTAEY